MTQILLDLISVRDGAFCTPEFDDNISVCQVALGVYLYQLICIIRPKPIFNDYVSVLLVQFYNIYVGATGLVVECRTRDSQVAGSNHARVIYKLP